MPYIITRSKSRRFKPHYNRSTGRYYGTRTEYLSDLKAKGLEPYAPEKVAPYKSKPYKPSAWAHDMIESKKLAKGKVGDVWLDEVRKKGSSKVLPSILSDIPTEGGFRTEPTS